MLSNIYLFLSVIYYILQFNIVFIADLQSFSRTDIPNFHSVKILGHIEINFYHGFFLFFVTFFLYPLENPVTEQ